ncbi:MAG: D-alanyl-D-alanine carboxypeptidase, partial [Oscillospiraceae bacterium]|nr:D-alanyl-D-alanine carboxypeptidase [Oscillospiraceae bacterium]
GITLFAEPVEAPIAEGDVLGEITLSYDGEVLDTVPLLASSSVSASKLLVFEKQVKDFLDKTIVKVILGVLAVLIVLLIARAAIYGRSSRRSRRGYAGVSSSGYRGRRRRR